MIKYDVGANAGIVWRVLSEKGSLTVNQMKEATGFDNQEIMMALGWLARENRIDFSHSSKEMLVSLSKVGFYY